MKWGNDHRCDTNIDDYLPTQWKLNHSEEGRCEKLHLQNLSNVADFFFLLLKMTKSKVQSKVIFLEKQNVGAWVGPGENHTITQFCRVLLQSRSSGKTGWGKSKQTPLFSKMPTKKKKKAEGGKLERKSSNRLCIYRSRKITIIKFIMEQRICNWKTRARTENWRT